MQWRKIIAFKKPSARGENTASSLLSLLLAMKNAAWLTLLFTLITATLCSHAADDSRSFVLASGSMVKGYSLGKWTERWWEWAFSMPLETSALNDMTGQRCGNDQMGPVWFLAGSYETGPVTRACTIPAGKYVFFPVINYVVYPNPRMPTRSCNTVTQAAKEMTDDAESLRVTVDGIEVTDVARYRERSTQCFDIAVRSGTGAKVYPSAANGYWLMLRPLPKGEHLIHFSGRLGDFSQNIAYKIFVSDKY